MGTLYVVGTPIGNLEDVSERALRILARVGLIASENPRRTQRLLARYDIETPMRRFTDAYDRKKKSRMRALLTALDEHDVALVSEAGMPGLADPGHELVAAALAADVPVVPVPGPTALGTVLSVAGLSGERFIFLGFLPRRTSKRRQLLHSLIQSPFALIAYEAPHRLLDTLADLTELIGSRQVSVACELTKLYEGIKYGTAAELLDYYGANRPRGEFTLVIAPPSPEATVAAEGRKGG